jgi:hypothetical protein
MRKKSVWLHKPFGNPRKILFSVTKDEVTLGDKVFPAGEVVGCKRNYAKPILKPINFVLTFGLLGWMIYELTSVALRLGILMALDMQPEANVARTNERLQDMLQALHLRASTTDDQQLQLFLWVYLSLILYGLIFSNLIFRPRVVLTLKNGEVAEAPFLLVRPQKFAKTLKAGRKLSKRNRKLLKQN